MHFQSYIPATEPSVLMDIKDSSVLFLLFPSRQPVPPQSLPLPVWLGGDGGDVALRQAQGGR